MTRFPRNRSRPVRRALLLGGLSCLDATVGAPAALAIQITPDTVATDYRFTANAGTANPTPNTDPSFVAQRFNLSSIGGAGYGGSGRLQSIDLISPISFEGAQHFHFHAGASISFSVDNGAGQSVRGILFRTPTGTGAFRLHLQRRDAQRGHRRHPQRGHSHPDL